MGQNSGCLVVAGVLFLIWIFVAGVSSDPTSIFLAIICFAILLFSLKALEGQGKNTAKRKVPASLILRYKKELENLNKLKRETNEKQQLLGNKERVVELLALLKDCGSDTVSFQENSNYKDVEKLKEQLAKLKDECNKAKQSVERIENKMK